jgi:hypothetical protein
MQTKIKKTYKRSSDSNLLKLGSRVAQNMKGNANFPNPTPAQTAVETACQDFQSALNLAGRSDRTLSSAKNDKKAVLAAMLDELAKYVTTVANGNKTILLSSGFDITGVPDSSQDLQPIDSLVVEIGTTGQATTRVKKVTGARAYIHEYTPDPITPNSVWTSEIITEQQCTFSKLQSIMKYWFRVTAVGPRNRKVYSPIVSRVIQ